MNKKQNASLLRLLTTQELKQLRDNFEINNKRIENDLKPIDCEPVVKLFNPTGIGSWYLSELSPDNIGFGLCHVLDLELGYVSLDILLEITFPPFGLNVEKDACFFSNGTTLSQLLTKLKNLGNNDKSSNNLKSNSIKLDRIHKKARSLVHTHIFTLQTQLVETCFRQRVFNWENIVNSLAYYDKKGKRLLGADLEKAMAQGDFYSEVEEVPQDIFEWYTVSDWLAYKLIEKGDPILENEYGIWWGRTCSGQAIYCDGIIQDISRINHCVCY